MTFLFDNGLLRKAIVHPTQFLGFEFISTEKFLLFSNENFQSIESYLNMKHTRAVVEVDSSPRFKICFFQVPIRHFFTIMLKDAWNIRLMSELIFICFNNYYVCFDYLLYRSMFLKIPVYLPTNDEFLITDAKSSR